MNKCPNCKNIVLEQLDGYNPPLWNCENCGGTFIDMPVKANPAELSPPGEKVQKSENPPCGCQNIEKPIPVTDFLNKDGSFEDVEFENPIADVLNNPPSEDEGFWELDDAVCEWWDNLAVPDRVHDSSPANFYGSEKFPGIPPKSQEDYDKLSAAEQEWLRAAFQIIGEDMALELADDAIHGNPPKCSVCGAEVKDAGWNQCAGCEKFFCDKHNTVGIGMKFGREFEDICEDCGQDKVEAMSDANPIPNSPQGTPFGDQFHGNKDLKFNRPRPHYWCEKCDKDIGTDAEEHVAEVHYDILDDDLPDFESNNIFEIDPEHNPLLDKPIVCKKCGKFTRFKEWMHKISDGWLCDGCYAVSGNPPETPLNSAMPVDGYADHLPGDRGRTSPESPVIDENPKNPSFSNWIFDKGVTKGVFITGKHDERALKWVESALKSILGGKAVKVEPYNDKGLIGYEITIPGEIPKDTLKELQKETHKIGKGATATKDYVFTPNPPVEEQNEKMGSFGKGHPV